ISAAATIAIAFSAIQSWRSQGLMASRAHHTANTRLRISRYFRCGILKRLGSAHGLKDPGDGQELAERQEAHQRERELRLDREQSGKCPERDHPAPAAHQVAHRLAAREAVRAA